MPYDPNIHHRRSIRLKGYDYSANGAYFITICAKNQECLFGEIANGQILMSDEGKIASRCLRGIPDHYPDATVDANTVMPNHIHFIVRIESNNVGANNVGANMGVGANNYSPLPTTQPIQRPHGTSRTIGSIVRGFKIGVTKQTGHSVWQRNYYERIIRNDDEYRRIVEYILNNPMNWRNDRLWIE
jgi:REP element-mobilizing transposase RayT